MADFTMFQGDTKVLEVTVVDGDGDAVDITGTTIRWKLAKKVSSTGANVLIQKQTGGSGVTIVDGLTGRFNVALDPADTLALKGSYYHEAEVNDGGIISTVLTGKAKIDPALIKPA